MSRTHLQALKSTLARLPRTSRWMLRDALLDFTFLSLHETLPPIGDNLLHAWAEANPVWRSWRVIGDYSYAGGGGSHPLICLRPDDAAVCGLDLEREDPVFIFNSTAERFQETFAYLESFLAKGAALPACAEDKLLSIDSEGFPRSEWRLLVAYLRKDG